MPNAPSPHPLQSAGDGCVLCLVDRTQPEYLHLPEVAFAALQHCGIPYRLWDVGARDAAAVETAEAAAVLIPQEHLGRSLSPAAVAHLLRAVEQEGLGLVLLDADLTAYGPSLRESLGLRGVGNSDHLPAADAVGVVVADTDHFITATQEPGARHHLRIPVPLTLVRAERPDTRILAVSAAGAPVLVARRVGAGCIVQWLVSPRIWTRGHLGHAHGLDDLFWKGIVWAARKPFAMLRMPPFVRLRFDDCQGLWRTAADWAFVDVLNKFGHRPTLCICVRALTPEGAARAHALFAEGRADFAPHTLAPETSLFYGPADRPYTPDELRALLTEVDESFRRWGITPSRILSDHDHEWSPAAAPLLRERGIIFKMNITLPGERWSDLHTDWRPAPYGSMSYALDTLPPPYDDFFVVFNHYPTFDAARTYLPDGRHFLYTREGGFGEQMWDFLNGLTRGPLRRTTDVEAAARRLADHTRLGLNSLFFGGSITHSHFTQALTPEEWRLVLERYEALTARLPKRNVSYDHIAAYARDRHTTRLVRVDRARGDRLNCLLAGRWGLPLEVAVYTARDDEVAERWEEVPPMEGRLEVVL